MGNYHRNIMEKEQIYDEQISPLVKKINALCKEHKLSTLMVFGIGSEETPEATCTTLLSFNEDVKTEKRMQEAAAHIRQNPKVYASTIIGKLS